MYNKILEILKRDVDTVHRIGAVSFLSLHAAASNIADMLEEQALQKANISRAEGDPLAVVGDIQKLRDDMAKLLDSGQVYSRSGKSYSLGFIAALDKVLGIISPTANGA